MSVSPSRQWLERASQDLAVARLVLREGYTAHACFLAQQTIEKALKAYLLGQASAYPRLHKLDELLSECMALDPAFHTFLADCIMVDQYYIPTRYPDSVAGVGPGGIPSESMAADAVRAAEEILNFVSGKLP